MACRRPDGAPGRALWKSRRYPGASSLDGNGRLEMGKWPPGGQGAIVFAQNAKRRHTPVAHARWPLGVVDGARGNSARAGVPVGASSVGGFRISCLDRSRAGLVDIQSQGSTKPSKSVKSLFMEHSKTPVTLPSTLPVHTLPSPMDFPAYDRAVQAIPMLSEDREKELVQAWTERKDREAARELVLSHLRLVTKAVKDHRGYGLPEGDLAQEGTVGLMRAVHGFDHRHGVRLAAYAWKWIEAEIREYIFRSWRLVRLGSGTTMRKLFFGYRKTMEGLRKWSPDRPVGVSVEDVARAMDLPEDQVLLAAQYFGGSDLPLLGADEEDSASSDRLMLEALPFASPAGPQDLAERVIDDDLGRQAISVAWQDLDERSQKILSARRFAEPAVPLREVAQHWGVSIERARQIEHAAWEKLVQGSRKALESCDVSLEN